MNEEKSSQRQGIVVELPNSKQTRRRIKIVCKELLSIPLGKWNLHEIGPENLRIKKDKGTCCEWSLEGVRNESGTLVATVNDIEYGFEKRYVGYHDFGGGPFTDVIYDFALSISFSDESPLVYREKNIRRRFNGNQPDGPGPPGTAITNFYNIMRQRVLVAQKKDEKRERRNRMAREQSLLARLVGE